ncbi:MAG: stage III sporulation protein AB [Oscillospiraceae bacterium]|nr:stage III sporulation protein AB [Oscillospiraceae bacterium]
MLTFCTSLIGYQASHKLFVRKIFLEEYLSFLNFVQTQIRYTAIAPHKIIEKSLGKNEINIFLNILKQNLKTDKTFFASWSNAIFKIKESFGLSKDDVFTMMDFGEKLGTSDVRSQLKLCDLHIKFINDHIKEAEQSKNQMSKLYLTLGVAAGMGISLLFL